MADRPPLQELIEKYGPHPVSVPAGGWESRGNHATETLVKTHCCFCGQQCGIQLKVRDTRWLGSSVGGVPVQSGQVVSEGREAVSAGCEPGPILPRS